MTGGPIRFGTYPQPSLGQIEFGTPNFPGPAQFVPGPSGKSAYRIAVENGFVGTEAEWLESLKGEDGQNGGGGAVGSIEYKVNNPLSTWMFAVPSAMGRTPNVAVYDENDELLIVGVHATETNVTIEWLTPQAGKVVLS